MKLNLGVYLFDAFAIALGVSLLLTGCNHPSQDQAKAGGEDLPADGPVRYVKVTPQTLPETLDLAAKVQADPTKIVRIFPPASGRVLSIDVKPGDHVRRGQAVASLSSADVANAQSDYAKANIEAERATRTMERQKVLVDRGAVAEKDYLDARAQADEARAELARAKQRLDMLNVSPSTTTDRVTLVSPDSGVVLDVSAAPGEFSKSLESANPLITIADLNTVWIVGDVFEKDVAKVGRGKPATVTLQAYPGQQWSGRIDSLSGALDATTRSLKVRVVLPNRDRRFKPEMFGTIQVEAGAHPALVVPATAIVREGNATIVFVKSAGKPEQRTVTVGQTVDGNVEILTGLHARDEVAADGAELLKGGPPE
ncbi:MAG: efflux RND transporter periplasmic adaptor subunit [Acidobacteria bacterium]|nr:MAG: efflux RND transporter periplasmic adaptor subunit [Acidobacteriota bacterium]